MAAELLMPRLRQVFRREGDYWTIAFDGEVVRLRDARGLHYLAVLLRQPGEPVHVCTLVEAASLVGTTGADGHARRDAAGRSQGVEDKPASAATERARLAVTKGIKTVLDRLTQIHPNLARHLSATVRRGYLCVYDPDPRVPIAWDG